MKKIFPICIVALFGISMLAFQPSVIADNGDGAVITKDFGCGFAHGGSSNVGTHSVVTPSGKTSLICHGTIAPPANGRASVLKGFGCGTFLGFTTDSKETLSASGKVTLTCKI